MSFVLLGILNSQAAGAAGGEAFELIQTVELTNSANISLTGLDALTDYKFLAIRAQLAGTNFNDRVMQITLNNDTTNGKYEYVDHGGIAPENGTANETSSTRTHFEGNRFEMRYLPGQESGGGTVADNYSLHSFVISGFNDPTVYTAIHHETAGNAAGARTKAINEGVRNFYGAYYDTANIFEIDITQDSGNIAAGSFLNLYGVR